MSNLVTHTINGREYQIGKLDPFKQMAVARRLAPLLPKLGPVVSEIQKRPELFRDAKDGKLEGIEDVLKSVEPLMTAFAQMDDADVNYILMNLLESASMKQSGGGFANVVVNGNLMFQDLEMPELVQIAWRAGVHNLGRFLPAKVPTSNAGK